MSNRPEVVAVAGRPRVAASLGILAFALFLGLVVGHRFSAGKTHTRDEAPRFAVLLKRFQDTVEEADRLLTETENDPSLVYEAAWRERDDRVVEALRMQWREAEAMAVDRSTPDVAGCIRDGIRLTYTGERLLHDGFLTDGHGAYYLSSHGNWDVNDGVNMIARCRSMLTSKSSARLPPLTRTISHRPPAHPSDPPYLAR